MSKFSLDRRALKDYIYRVRLTEGEPVNRKKLKIIQKTVDRGKKKIYKTFFTFLSAQIDAGRQFDL